MKACRNPTVTCTLTCPAAVSSLRKNILIFLVGPQPAIRKSGRLARADVGNYDGELRGQDFGVARYDLFLVTPRTTYSRFN